MGRGQRRKSEVVFLELINTLELHFAFISAGIAVKVRVRNMIRVRVVNCKKKKKN